MQLRGGISCSQKQQKQKDVLRINLASKAQEIWLKKKNRKNRDIMCF